MSILASLPASMISPWLTVPLLGLYAIVLAVIMIYGLHRYFLLHLFRKHGGPLWNRDWADAPLEDRAHWPLVTVQLPMFNEKAVARRAITAVCQLDYPRKSLEIQILDDSTDESAQVATQVVDEMAALGHAITLIHRDNRKGFKAGALANGLEYAKGKIIAIFDADFVPMPDFLKRTVPNFDSEDVGMVQTRWVHLNRDHSSLTRSQAVLLDGHFVIEHTARAASGRWFNFNGTAGVWRRECIEDAGGWGSDTLTEDVDLSYRAQLKGWRFVYDPTIECPAELPPYVTAFKTQQHRWTKGSVQTGIKLLPTIWRSDATFARKVEATFHLTAPVVSRFVVLLTLLIFPSFLVPMNILKPGTLRAGLFGVTLLAIATGSAGVFYVASQRRQGLGLMRSILLLPMVLAVGIGISVNNARAVIEALVGHTSPFVRTPKVGDDPHAKHEKRSRERRLPRGLVETTLGILMSGCVVFAVVTNQGVISIPFLVLFAIGYLAVGIGTMRDQWLGLA